MDRVINLILTTLLALTLYACVRPAIDLTPLARRIDIASTSIIRLTGDRGEHGPMVCTGEVVRPYRALTASHCMAENMLADGGPVEIIQIDPVADLMLLALSTSKPPIVLATRPIQRFQQLTAIGYAHGSTLLTPLGVHVLTIGVSPLSTILPAGLTVQGQYIAGMSGGPVVDDRGEMVGIIQQASDEGMGYGVDVQTIRAFLKVTQ